MKQTEKENELSAGLYSWNSRWWITQILWTLMFIILEGNSQPQNPTCYIHTNYNPHKPSKWMMLHRVFICHVKAFTLRNEMAELHYILSH